MVVFIFKEMEIRYFENSYETGGRNMVLVDR